MKSLRVVTLLSILFVASMMLSACRATVVTPRRKAKVKVHKKVHVHHHAHRHHRHCGH